MVLQGNVPGCKTVTVGINSPRSGFSGSVNGQIDGPASERRLEREGHWNES